MTIEEIDKFETIINAEIERSQPCFTKNNSLHKHDVISRLYMWWIRNFKVISNQKAKELGLRHWRGVYGDEINHQNCRSLWFDNKQRIYRVSHLEDVS